LRHAFHVIFFQAGGGAMVTCDCTIVAGIDAALIVFMGHWVSFHLNEKCPIGYLPGISLLNYLLILVALASSLGMLLMASAPP
jgi:hypothetical protein